MHIVVLGAGAIGGVYGARLSTAHDVTLLTRSAHAEAINRDGLRITGAEERTYHVHAATTIDRIEPDTLIVLTTKVSDSEQAVRTVAALVQSDTVILCVQNGLYSEDLAKAGVFHGLMARAWKVSLAVFAGLVLLSKPLTRFLHFPSVWIIVLMAVAIAFYIPVGVKRGSTAASPIASPTKCGGSSSSTA